MLESYELLRRLSCLPIPKELIIAALHALEAPYDLNEVVHLIRTQNLDHVEQSPEFYEVAARAEPFVGMKVWKQFGNTTLCGEVTHEYTEDSEQM